MNISDEREFWEALRNQQPVITVEGALVGTVTKHLKQLVSLKFMFFLLAIPTGMILPGMLWGLGMVMSLSSGSKDVFEFIIPLAALFVILGVFCFVCGILTITKGTFLKSDYKELARYRASTEWGVMTLKRK